MTKTILPILLGLCIISSCNSNKESSSSTSSTDSMSQMTPPVTTAVVTDTMANKNAMPTDTSNINSGNSTASTGSSSGSTGQSLYRTTNKRSKYTGKTAGEFPEGSERKLTEKDVEFLSPWGLKVLQNEIYARHGMTFTDEAMGSHFKTQSWYHSNASYSSSSLTAVEKENLRFLKSYKYKPGIN
ncbi:MAG: YARHG domain-containing protein [Taibaiella sp.]|nr:YARHG domain-containing protein [Taibaiella sp.]